MPRLPAIALSLLSLLAMPACTADFAALGGGAGGGASVGSEAGGAEACRQTTAQRLGLPPEQAQVQSLGRDAQGFGSYRVSAGGQTELCYVDANNVVMTL